MTKIASGTFLLLAWAFSATAGAQQHPGTPMTGGWQAPPPPAAWPAQEHHGYQDGVEAAWLDLRDKLSPDPGRHLTYKHPPGVKVNRRYQYREGFRKGYEVVYGHFRKHGGVRPAAAPGKTR